MSSQPSTPSRNLAGYFARSAEGEALWTVDGSMSHAELGELVSHWRATLAGAGVTKGDRVAIFAGNSSEFVAVHLATIGVGAISVPLNHEAPPLELVPQIEAVEPAAIFVDASAESAWTAITATERGLSELRVVATAVGDLPTELADPGLVEVSDADPAMLLFTSGTAGTPKPAILTHGNLLSSLQSVLSLPIDLVNTPQTYLAVIPLFHIFGIHMVVHLALITGGTIILENYHNAERMMQLVRERQPTVVAGPPALWQRMLDQGGQATDFSSVKLAVSGAAALPPRLAVQVEDQLGLVLHEGYGLTESSAVATSTIAVEDPPLGSVGLLMPGMEARIVEADGTECLTGDPGELWLRGPMISPGYWGESQVHSSRAEGGWLRTGDTAVVDEGGYLAIVGRLKDLIIVSGFNVYPGEVEAALLSHPKVEQVGVVGEPMASTGEAVVAFVVPVPGAVVDDSELWEFCRERLARYKVPHRFVIAEQLPLGPSGKLRRNQLLTH